MSFEYQPNPSAIEQDSFRQIRLLTDLSGLSDDAQQVVMRVIHSVGDPLVAQHMRISANACAAGRGALAKHQAILCDVEMVKQGITKRMIHHIENGRFQLLEKLAADLLAIASEPERVSFAEVRVDKPHALRFADSVSVTLSATR